jgi:hypothetical protein
MGVGGLLFPTPPATPSRRKTAGASFDEVEADELCVRCCSDSQMVTARAADVEAEANARGVTPGVFTSISMRTCAS